MSIKKLFEIGNRREGLNEDTGDKLFSIELADKTFVVRAKSRGEAIVFLSGIVGKDMITKSRDQLQQHFGPVVQVNRGSGDVEELDPKDVRQLPPPIPGSSADGS